MKIGIFGGTFDPIHFGHLSAALELKEQLRLDRVHFVPCHYPPHRSHPVASGKQRIAMVTAALADEKSFVADNRELLKESASFSIETIDGFRQEYGNDTSLYFFMGMDSLLNFTSWHRWKEFLNVCHIVVAARPGATAPQEDTEIGRYCLTHQTTEEKTHGTIRIFSTTPLEISASKIRKKIIEGSTPRFLLPESSWSFIKEHKLYGYS